MLTLKVSIQDLIFLLKCEEKAQSHPRIGYVGASLLKEDIIRHLNKSVDVSIDAIESALFSWEQLKEIGIQIEHPHQITPVTLANRLLVSGWGFNKDLGVFYRKGNKNGR